MKTNQLIKLVIVLLFIQTALNAQNKVIHFNYDNSGNRIARWIEVIPLNMQKVLIANDSLKVDNLSTLQQDTLHATSLFKVYPNPVGKMLNIQNSELDLRIDYSYQIFDQSGRLFLSGKSDQSLNAINMENAKSGIYYLVVICQSDDKKLLWKLIKP